MSTHTILVVCLWMYVDMSLYLSLCCSSNDIVYKEKRRPIMRSKSDVTHRYCGTRPVLTLPPPLLMTPGQLELFFDHLGLDPVNYRSVIQQQLSLRRVQHSLTTLMSCSLQERVCDEIWCQFSSLLLQCQFDRLVSGVSAVGCS